ncbi:MAG: hypothetical protein ACXABY_24000, partial [Candidatus Thorarchaeota archaeon]
TVANLLENIRYDLQDYEEGLNYDDRLLYIYINRMIGLMDSSLSSMRSDLVHGTETEIDTVSSQNYVDLTNMNNGQWDSIRDVWIGEDRKCKVSIDLMYYKRKWYSSDAEPQYWTLEGRRLIWETTADAAHTDLVIHYDKKHRKRLETFSETFTADAANNDVQVASGVHTFVTGDGPFRLTTTNTLPSGLSTGTDYWAVFQPDNAPDFNLATSKANALDNSVVNISDTGTGTHTIAWGSNGDYMPWDGIFDELIREMIVMHAKAKMEGNVGQPEAIYGDIFRKRAFEERIRRSFIPKRYRLDF